MLIQIFSGRVIAVRAWVETDENSQIIPHNFGDDINKPLLEALLGRRVLCVDDPIRLPRPGIMAIGSMFPWHIASDVYVWGTGVLEDSNRATWGKPIQVCSVRGPRTRKYLLNNGIDCPEIYGDPALLMPMIYNPFRLPKHQIGIIPHWRDIELPHIQQFLKANPDVLLINFKNYDSWQHVIDQICCCEMIISSSLHGLIISDAYGIPNVFAQFSDLVEGGDYKYHDYMEGIGREWIEPLDFRNNIDRFEASHVAESYRPIHFDSVALLRAFPFPLVPEFQKLV